MTTDSPETTSMKDDFDRDGFVAVDPLFNASEMAEINSEVARFLVEGVPQMPPERVYLEERNDRNSIKQLLMLFEYSPFFRSMMFDGPIRRIAEEVLGDAVMPMNMQFFNKPAGIGQPTPPHQDGYYFHLSPCEAVTGWLALEPVDHENGCIHYVRGSNNTDTFRPHGKTGVLGFSQGITDFGKAEDVEGTVACPGGAGTFLMHHARTIHWAGANTSPTRSRRALGFIYYAERAKVDLAAKEAYQTALEARLKTEGRI